MGMRVAAVMTRDVDAMGPHTPPQANQCRPAIPASVLITEIMYNPASSEDAWEYVEVHNPGATPVDLSGWVMDDSNSNAHSAANIASGVIPAGQSAVLYNADDITDAEFTAAWGPNINLIAVTGWSKLALNNGGDTVGLWSSFSDYSGDHQTHANAHTTVAYDDSGAWPSDDGSASIYLTDLTADPADGANWALSAVGTPTPLGTGRQSTAAGGNSGNDIGSPGVDYCSWWRGVGLREVSYCRFVQDTAYSYRCPAILFMKA